MLYFIKKLNVRLKYKEKYVTYINTLKGRDLYYTKKIEQSKTQEEKDEIIKALKSSSIMHWSYVNLYGEYDFTRSSKKIHRLIALEGDK